MEEAHKVTEPLLYKCDAECFDYICENVSQGYSTDFPI